MAVVELHQNRADPECASHPAVGAAAAGMTIGDVAEQTGIGPHTLRYYERIGLLRVPRDQGGRRVYGPTEVGRVVFINLLRAAQMPIADLQAYFGLVADGPGNESARAGVLARHRDRVAEAITEMQTALQLIDLKLALYRGDVHA